MRLDRHWIAAHIPHAGKMCLLDEVLTWDASASSAAARRHRAPTIRCARTAGSAALAA